MSASEALISANQMIGDLSPLCGLARMHHVNTRGQPISFAGRPFLVEIYDYLGSDFVGEVCFQKAVQVGISEAILLWMFYRSGWQGRIVAYLMPDRPIMNRFVQVRVNPVLSSVPAFRARLPGGAEEEEAKRVRKRVGGSDPNNLARKRFGPGAMLFIAATVASDFVEFTADALINDEYDQCDPTFLSKADDRLRESKRKQVIRISNPTLPDEGIAKLYAVSDGRRWNHVCTECGEEQPLDWEINIVQRDETGRYVPRDTARAARAVRWVALKEVVVNFEAPDIRPVCRKCNAPFERGQKPGKWIATRPDEGRPRGYHMSRLDVLTDRIAALFKEFVAAVGDSAKMGTFYASVLGLPHEGAGMAVTTEILRTAACGDPIDRFGGEDYNEKTITMGIDVGSVLNVQISELSVVENEIHRRSLFVGAVLTETDIDDLIARYRVKHCVIDAGPEGRFAQSLRDRHREAGDCAVWLCRFHPQPRVGEDRYARTLDREAWIVSVDRTQVFDTALDELLTGKHVLPVDVFSVLGFAEQMKTPKRRLNQERNRFEWSKTKEADHYRLADVYDLIAADLSQEVVKIVTINARQPVTPTGGNRRRWKYR